MIRKAAPPARRRLLSLVVLVTALWLGQGVAAAATIGVDPQSGPPGTTVGVTLTDFPAVCVVLFDEQVVAISQGCEDTTISFKVPDTAAEGDHEVRAVGQGGEVNVTDQVATFTVTAAAPQTEDPDAGAGDGAGQGSADQDSARQDATSEDEEPGTSEPGVNAPPGVVFGAACEPGQPALVRFALDPITASPGDALSATTSWGLVGSCTDVGGLQVHFDGEPLDVDPPEAGVNGTFPVEIPEDAGEGSHRVSLTSAAAPLTELMGVDVDVETAGRSAIFLVGLAVAVVAVVLALVLALRRRGRRSEADDEENADPELLDPELLDPELFDVGDQGASGVPEERKEERAESGVRILRPAGEGNTTDTTEIQSIELSGSGDKDTAETVDDEDADDGGSHADQVGLAPGRPEPEAMGSPVTPPPPPSPQPPAPPTPPAPPAVPPSRPTTADEDTMPVVPLVVASGRDGSFYLFERQNPHAPQASNGRRGWYGLGRSSLIRAIIVQTVGPHTAGSAASELASTPVPSSAHVVVDADGALELLPYDVVAIHRPQVDEVALVMLLAGFGVDAGTDELILGHAVGWLAPRMETHAIPVWRVTVEQVADGEAGVVCDEATFPWRWLETLVEGRRRPHTRAEWLTGSSAGETRSDPDARLAAGTEVGAEVDAEVDDVRDPGGVGAESAGTDAGARAEPAAAAYDRDVAVGPGGAPAAANEPEPDVRARPTRPPREPHPLPSPDALIAQVLQGQRYHLLEHENPHATLRANGKHGWYYPTRSEGIRAIVLHSLGGVDSAEEMADHLLRVKQPLAAHVVADPDAIIQLLPDEATALRGSHVSTAALDLAFAYEPVLWGSDPASEEPMVVRAATWAGVRAARHRIPVRRIGMADWRAGASGIAGRDDVDPGTAFPWQRFIQLTAWVARRVTDQMSARDPSETARSGSPPT